MHWIDGQTLAARIRGEAKENVQRLGITPKLNVMLVGEDTASQLYVSLKKKAAEEIGVVVEVCAPPSSVTDNELVDRLRAWNVYENVRAILVQLPLPEGHEETRVLQAVDPRKDVDGFLPDSACVPPVHEGILRLVNETPLRLNGAAAALIVNSDVFARPLERLLKNAGARVNVMNPNALNAEALAQADLVIIAVGRAGFLRASMVKNDAVIIDVGTNKNIAGKTVGDVDAESFQNTDVWISPVPGGVGPMTIAELLKNVVSLSGQR